MNGQYCCIILYIIKLYLLGIKYQSINPSQMSSGDTVTNISCHNYTTQLLRKLFITKLSQNSYLNYH